VNILYFAYGANMNHGQMKERCGQSRFLKRAYLEGHKFVFDGYSDYLRRRSVANVVNSDGNVVWGALYEIDEEDVKALDASEYHPSSFEKKTATVKDEDGKSYEALVYYRSGRSLGAPSKEYRQTIIQGAKDCKLPKDYTMKIAYRISG
jgi:gamma-glutamylcyclotransferase